MNYYYVYHCHKWPAKRSVLLGGKVVMWTAVCRWCWDERLACIVQFTYIPRRRRRGMYNTTVMASEIAWVGRGDEGVLGWVKRKMESFRV